MRWIKTFEELTKIPGQCDRCGKPSKSFTGSWLNTEMICMDCAEREKEEPDYQVARDIENQEVRKGNLNYPGIRENKTSLTVRRLEIPYETFEKNSKGEFIKEKTVKGTSKIIDLMGRKVVVFDINGMNVPFYLSSGTGGKKNVPSGKWYPFLGVGSDLWFNKSTNDLIGYFGNSTLEKISKELDRHIGDVRTDETIPKVKSSGIHIDFINKNLNPTENETFNTKSNYERNKIQFLKNIST